MDFVSVGMIIPYIYWKNKKCSKPPTSIYIYGKYGIRIRCDMEKNKIGQYMIILAMICSDIACHL